MENKLSTLHRDQLIKKLSTDPFDLLVIGGGITGAGIALDASSRGMKVALIEKNDFASGTSSKSTKLIHGGLRYLKQLEFGLVREVGQEREILYQNAPHLVIPENMLLPIVEDGSLGRLSTGLGLTVYDWLAGVKFSEWKSMLRKYGTRKKEPLLRNDILLGGAIYKEYRTDDARLVIEVIKTAAQYDSYCINYAECTELTYKNGTVAGAVVQDKIENRPFNIVAKKVINAAGPWVDELREKDHSLKGKRLHLTKGVHLVVPYEKLPVQQSAYFDVEDGRMIFVIPRDDITYIGTTDTNYKKDIDSPQVTKEDAQYLLDAVNKMFPTVKLTLKDVTSSWVGLRPLIHEEGKSPSELSRKDEIFYSKSGLISIAGGKLTGYRKMAERATDVVAYQLIEEEGKELQKCHTDEITLSGGEFNDAQEIPEYIESLIEEHDNEGFSPKQIKKLVNRYGSNTGMILQKAKLLESASPEEQLLKAELDYGINEEIVTNLNDFLIRRTGKLYFDRGSIANEYPILQKEIKMQLSWDEKERQRYDQLFQKEYQSVIKFE